VVQVQVPTFFSRQVLENEAFGEKVVPSGIVTSEMYCARSQPAPAVGTAVFVGTVEVGGMGVGVGDCEPMDLTMRGAIHNG
jgi:hypothetical protein